MLTDQVRQQSHAKPETMSGVCAETRESPHQARRNQQLTLELGVMAPHVRESIQQSVVDAIV